MNGPLRVCYFGAYNPAYSRNAVLRAGLRHCGVEVTECRVSPRVPIALRPAALLARFAGLGRTRFDAFVVAELNAEVAWLARLLGALRGTPVVLDIFFSKYDSLVHDRATEPGWSPRALALRLIEAAAVRTAHVVLADTAAHAAYYRRVFAASRTRFEVVPVGADERLFHPPAAPKPSSDQLVVGFWGTYIPLHGTETIVEAAALLRDEPIRFELIGTGQTFARTAALVQRLGARDVRLLPPVPLAEVAGFARRCDIALGIFGTTPKAARVVPHKVFQAMLTGLPVITRDSPAARELFRDGEHLVLVPPADPRALAEAIRRLHRSAPRRARLGQAARDLARRRFTAGPIGERLALILNGLAGRHR